MSHNNATLRPQYWVLRPQTNSMVPLIALDELPPTLSIRGVPRLLEVNDLTGMTCVGSAEARHRTYVVEMPNETRAPVPDNSLASTIFASSSYGVRSTPSPNPNFVPQLPKAYGIAEQMPSHIKSPVNQNQVAVASFPHAPLRVDRNPGLQALPPWQDSTSVPMKAAPGVKEYCSYWLRCGECDYAQQGCLYKHEMPLDREVLERLGHRDIPKWYRERHGLGSFLAGGNDGSGVGEKNERMERSWRVANATEMEAGDIAPGKGEGRLKSVRKVEKLVGSKGREAKNVEPKATLWRYEWEKNADGRIAPRSKDKAVVVGRLSPTPTKTSPVKISPIKARDPASRSAPSTPIPNSPSQSALAKQTDEACLAALDVNSYTKSREQEDLKRIEGHEVLQPELRSSPPAKPVSPETSSSDESADFEYALVPKDEESEWVEGDVESQRAAIGHGLREMRSLKGEK